ncbi:hypothetical protein HY214_03895 [Candidatus Roizmanbacteria bacterium]|nr:hypothetical protein [Candidatus Roizmanbacteria bacterium]
MDLGYNECFKCNYSHEVYQDSCGNYSYGVDLWDPKGCATWCGNTPTLTPVPTNPPPTCAGSLPAPVASPPSCSSTGQTLSIPATISWAAAAGADYYSLRIDDTTDGTPSWSGDCSNLNPGDICADVTGTSYSFAANPNHKYIWWLNSRENCNPNVWSAQTNGLTFQCGPNCVLTSGPNQIVLGQTAAYSATFTSTLGDYLGGVGAVIDGSTNPVPISNWDWNPPSTGFPGTSGSVTFSWTPASIGTYTIFCRAWNDGVAECRGVSSAVDAPPRYACNGSGVNGATTGANMTVNVIVPPPWNKLLNSSFQSVNALVNNVPPNITAFNGNDPGHKAFIDSNGNGAGIAVSAGLVTVNQYDATAKASQPNNWFVQNAGFSPLFTPASFVSYLQSRKQFTKITNCLLSTITGNGLYLWPGSCGPLTISSTANFDAKKVVLVVDQQTLTFPNNFIPAAGTSVAFIVNNGSSTNLTIANTVSEIDAILISGGKINTGAAQLGLDIKGNLITQGGFDGSGVRSTSLDTAPAVFIEFDPAKYLDVLPYISIATYDWQQRQ